MDEDSLIRIFIAHHRPKCWVCGRDDTWRALTENIQGNPTRLVLGAVWPDGTPVEDYSLAVSAVCCARCGNVWLVARDVLGELGDSLIDGGGDETEDEGEDESTPEPH